LRWRNGLQKPRGEGRREDGEGTGRSTHYARPGGELKPEGEAGKKEERPREIEKKAGPETRESLKPPPRLPTGMGIGWAPVLLFALPSLVGPPSESRYFLPDFAICCSSYGGHQA
jgi:hypothetical protein